MRGVIAPWLVLASSITTGSADDGPVKPPLARSVETAADRAIEVLLNEYEAKRAALIKAYEGATNDAERAGIAATDPLEEIGRRILAFARAHETQRAGLRALLWITANSGTVAEADPAWAFDRIARDHIDAPEIVDALDPPTTPHAAWESLARAAVARSPHRSVRGFACYALGCYLAEMVPLLEGYAEAKADVAKEQRMSLEEFFARRNLDRVMSAERAEIVAGIGRLEERFGRDYLDRLARRGHAEIAAEADNLVERARDEFGDVPLEEGRTLGDLARSELYDRRQLAIGRPAPEVSSEDIDGKPLKLSDYRGKVVVLSFWATWCGPCMELVPQERDLVKKYEGRPFALLGVNGDEDWARTKQAIFKERMVWRSWWNGGPDGSITRQWNIKSWPTLIVIDAKGVIREKGCCDEEDLSRVIDALLKETERLSGKPACP